MAHFCHSHYLVADVMKTFSRQQCELLRVPDDCVVTCGPSASGSDGNAAPWTTEEQKLLEQALKTYPVNTPERWEKIAAAVRGRSKKDCMKRYKVCCCRGLCSEGSCSALKCFYCSDKPRS